MLAIRTALTFALALAAAAPVYADATDDLFVAARGGTASDVRAAVSAGADPGARTEKGITPLHWAARENDAPSVIAALIEAGADPDARTEDGLTPLHAAAALNPAPSVIAALIEAGADPAARAEKGLTPLHMAALENPAPSVIAALIEAGADPDARNEDGLTPLHMAVVNNDPAVIEALIQAGADPNMRDFSSLFTPLMMAELLGNSAAIKALRKAMTPATIKATPLRDPHPASLPRSPETVSSPYDGSRPPRSVAEIRVYCEREWLQIGGWSMVKDCVDMESRAFKALHP